MNGHKNPDIFVVFYSPSLRINQLISTHPTLLFTLSMSPQRLPWPLRHWRIQSPPSLDVPSFGWSDHCTMPDADSSRAKLGHPSSSQVLWYHFVLPYLYTISLYLLQIPKVHRRRQLHEPQLTFVVVHQLESSGHQSWYGRQISDHQSAYHKL